MSFYQPYIKGRESDESVILPANINRDASIETLQEFARSHGFDPEKWAEKAEQIARPGIDERRAGLAELFSHVSLQKLPDSDPRVEDPLNNVNWRPFYQGVDDEPGLFSLPREVYERRIQDGVLNAVLNSNGELIGTMNAIPKLTPALCTELGIAQDDPRAPQVYETGAALITKPYRGVGLYDTFRSTVLSERDIAGRLILSQGRGKGATQVNVKNGWSLVKWRDFPFTSCLLGWACDTKGTLGGGMPASFQLAAGARFILPQNGLYQGHTVHFSASASDTQQSNDRRLARVEEFLRGRSETKKRHGQKPHEWHKYHHLMTNDYDKLVRFEAHLLINKGLVDYNSDTDMITISGENDYDDVQRFKLEDLDVHELREIYDHLHDNNGDVLRHVYKEWQKKAYSALSNDADRRLQKRRSDLGGELGVPSNDIYEGGEDTLSYARS